MFATLSFFKLPFVSHGPAAARTAAPPVTGAPLQAIPARRCLRVHGAARVRCVRGSLWVTQDGDPRDVTLEAGESFTFDREGGAMLMALADAVVWLER